MFEDAISFDDVLMVPRFSMVKSRKDVSLFSFGVSLPVISSNMDTITESKMAQGMHKAGGFGALHRFCSIEDNVKMFQDCMLGGYPCNPISSIGIGIKELERAEALYSVGATKFLIDVAHGANIDVVRQFIDLRNIVNNSQIIVGNFATSESIKSFLYHLGVKKDQRPDAYKVGIGGGSMCTTRLVTGCGIPTLASILDCSVLGYPIIADGGIRNSGDIAKALAAGADAVMLGGMLAGTDETPGEVIEKEIDISSDDLVYKYTIKKFKKYRGSASFDSYVDQDKVAKWRSPEGEATLVPYKGSVLNVLEQIEGGLRSALSYVGANNLEEFRENVEFVRVTPNGVKESQAHGKQ